MITQTFLTQFQMCYFVSHVSFPVVAPPVSRKIATQKKTMCMVIIYTHECINNCFATHILLVHSFVCCLYLQSYKHRSSKAYFLSMPFKSFETTSLIVVLVLMHCYNFWKIMHRLRLVWLVIQTLGNEVLLIHWKDNKLWISIEISVKSIDF